MSVDRSKRLNNMFPTPKTTNIPAGDPLTPANISSNEDNKKGTGIPNDNKTDNDLNKIEHVPENINIEPLVNSTKDKLKATDKDKPTTLVPETDINKKKKGTEVTKSKEPQFYIGCRVSEKMKVALEDMAKDFAYMARKQYGLKIKDDSSSIQRAFLLIGMSCFTEKIRHKTLQEYDSESQMQDEVSQQLIALMRIHNVEIDDIDF